MENCVVWFKPEHASIIDGPGCSFEQFLVTGTQFSKQKACVVRAEGKPQPCFQSIFPVYVLTIKNCSTVILLKL